MKILIFAGGSGKRLWPISRRKKPKQFIKLIDNTSTYLDIINKLYPIYGWNNIFVSTNTNHIKYIKEQTPDIPLSNIFEEPECRDIGPAAGLALLKLKKLGVVNEPVAILWSDSLIKEVKKFQKYLKQAKCLINQEKAKMVILGDKPLFANSNIGWIKIGSKIKGNIYEFKQFLYRPNMELCENFIKRKNALWNTGYFISTIDLMLKKYEKYNSKLYKKLLKIEKYLDTQNEAKIINEIYPKLEKINFDHAVAYHITPKETKIIKTNMGWEDPGTLYALKKYFKPSNKNHTKGNVLTHKSKDCLIYNYDKKKLVAGVNLDSMIIVNTKDALLVVHKNHVREVSEMLKSDKLKKTKLKKYL